MSSAWRIVNAGLFLLLCGYVWFVTMSLALGAPVLLDFSVFWSAGRLALHGQAALAYDWPGFDRALVVLTARRPDDIGPWFYPPLFFVAVAPLALLPLPAAAAAWLGATAAALVAAVRAILPGTTAMLATLAAPVVFFNLCSGENGLLSAALLGGGLVLVDRRPWLGGALFGALAYKPQLGILLPLVLAVAGRWRAIGGAAAAIIVLATVSGTLFGWDTFPAFAREMLFADRHFLGGEVGWDRLQSLYGLARTAGCPGPVAWAVHGAVAIAAAAASCAIWRRPVAPAVKAASLATAVVLVTPYSEHSDLAILIVAMAFLLGDGQRSGLPAWQGALLGFAYMAPFLFLFVPLLGTLSGLGPAMCAALVAVIAGRLRAKRTVPALAPA